MERSLSATPIAAALLTALALTLPVPALAGPEQDQEQARKELERAREEVEKARIELQKATRSLARSMAKVERDNPTVQYFEYMTDPRRAVLGVLIPDDNESDETRGVRLLAVTPGSGAEKAGLKAGDLVTALNGKSMAAEGKKSPQHQMRTVMRALKAGDEVKVEYERDGRGRGTTVVTQAPDQGFPMAMPPIPLLEGLEKLEDLDFVKPLAWGFRGPAIRGLELAKLDEDLGPYFKTTEGVLVIKSPKSGVLELKGGDVIQKIDGVSVSEPVTVLDKLRSRGEEQTVKLEIVRDGRKMELQGRIPVAELMPSPFAPRPAQPPRPPKPPKAPAPPSGGRSDHEDI